MGAIFDTHHPWVLVFGVFGNIFSLGVFLAPIPTFYQVYKKKSTENFQSLPYLVALFSAMLWIYYASLKTNAFLLISVNSIGCFIETIYVAMFMAYAPRKAKILTAKFLLLLNLGLFSLIFLLTFFLAKGSNRVQILGWVCVAFSTTVFIAPLSIIRLVMRTKSIEFMPFYLSLFLTLSAMVWFMYGLLTKDLYVYLPNILGFFFGILQMVLYLIYKNAKKPVIDEAKHVMNVVIDVVKLSPEIRPLEEVVMENKSCMFEAEKKHEQTNPNEKNMGI